MTRDLQPIYATRAKTSASSRLPKLVLSTLLFMGIVVVAGCNGIGSPDPRLVGSWYTGTTGSLILRADGTYVQTLKGTFPTDSMITNESGKWGVKDGRLNLRNEKTSAILNYTYNLNDKGDQLQLTLDSPINPGRVTITYRTSPNP